MPSHAEIALPAEARLLFACARWPLTPSGLQSVRAAAAQPLCWDEFQALAAHHRLLPLVFRALTAAQPAMPPHVDRSLREAAAANAHAVLSWLKLVREIQNLLAERHIPVVVLKGVPLSLDAYADPSLRQVGDVDLLIAPTHAEVADALLAKRGWRRKEPAALLTPRRRRAYRHHGKDYTYEPSDERAASERFELDLHWRLFRNPAMPGNRLADPAALRDIELGGLRLRVLSRTHSFLHACIHGALDGWFRLKSLADAAALWARFSASEREDAIALARRHGVLTEMAAALALARSLTLLTPEQIPDSLQLLESDPAVGRILRYATELLLRHRFRPGPLSAGSWAMKRYELGLHPGLKYKLPILRRILFRPRTWETFDLPDALYPLYALLSPLEWAFFHLGRRARKQRIEEKPPARRPRLPRLWRRWRRLPWRDRLLLAEALLTLLGARALLRVLTPKSIAHWIRSAPPGPAEPPQATLERVRWSVLVAARHAPIRLVCFPQALAGHAMLRRRGIGSELVYGVRRAADGNLRAHTWLRAGNRILLGGETAPLFTPVDAWSSAAVAAPTERA